MREGQTCIVQWASRLMTGGVLVACGLLPGCGGGDHPRLAPVTGTVKVDGTPVAGATIGFYPENGRPAFGKTDESGTYTMSYLDTEVGAVIGNNIVRIQRGVVTGEGEPAQKPKEPSLPSEYNDESELRADVKPGGNTFNFDVKSKSDRPKPPPKARSVGA